MSKPMLTTLSFKGLVEFSPRFAPRARISHVLFDFDGTLSLIRQGWPEVMLPMFLASGTDEQFVKQEAELLDSARYFNGHIYGAQDDYRSFSKKMVIERILRENKIPGDQLLAFGDGYVEIENTKEVGGLAVAVASDEANNGSGQMDEWKRQRLLGVGADVVIPDYRDGSALLETIFGR